MSDLTDHQRAEYKRALAAAELVGDEDAAFEAKVALGRVSAAERRAAALLPNTAEGETAEGEGEQAQQVEEARHTAPKGRTTRPGPQMTAPAGK